MKRTSCAVVSAALLALLLVASCREEEEMEPEPDFGGLPFGENSAFQNPLLDAKEGEWAIYRRMDGQEMRWEVIDIHPRTRALKVQETMRDAKVDQLLRQSEVEFGPNHMLAGFVSARQMLLQIYFDEIRVAGRTWLALCVDAAGSMTGRVRQWYSVDVPVTGLLRQEIVEPSKTRILTELVDWSGRTGEGER